MIYEELRELHERRPFRAFTLLLGDGTKAYVPRPQAMWLPSKPSQSVAVERPEGRILLVDLLLVAAVEVQPVRPAGRNGRAPRGKG